MKIIALIMVCSLAALACSQTDSKKEEGPKSTLFTGAAGEVTLMTVDPGHFHASLVQKVKYPQIDSVAYIYAPIGSDGVQRHLSRIELYNNRYENPTNWVEKVYEGPDFFEHMLEKRPGNVVVLAGNNARKTEYIKKSIDAGLNVLSDKPMVIKPKNYGMLKKAISKAQNSDALLYDIMTERFEITTLLQRKLSQDSGVFGTLVKGTPENPAITKESVHHFFKYVSGQPLTRPAWFFDVDQQGEAIVDVSTHLVDLILWETYPGIGIDTTETEVVSAKRWATQMTPEQFERVTKLDSYPDYLKEDLDANNNLQVFANGSFVFTVRGVHSKVSAAWNYQAPEGAGDTHYSIMRGTKANLVIRQGKEQGYTPRLYVEPVGDSDNDNGGEEYKSALKEAVNEISAEYAGLSLQETSDGWQVVIPDDHRIGHEAHFGQVMQQYLEYLVEGEIPEWEQKNMLTKYFLTMQAYQKSR